VSIFTGVWELLSYYCVLLQFHEVYQGPTIRRKNMPESKILEHLNFKICDSDVSLNLSYKKYFYIVT
jgi:hypothetical protein